MESLNWRFEIDDDLFRRIVAMQFGLDAEITNEPCLIDRYWISNFCSVITKPKIHGSFDYCFENAAYKIRQLHIHTKETRDIEKKLISIVNQAVSDSDIVEFGDFGVNILVGHLLLREYLNENALIDFAMKRIQAIYETIQSFQYDIYIEKASTKAVPKAFRGQKIVNPELTKTSLVSLPLIYDILYFHVIGRRFPNLMENINTIIDYILTIEYQSFARGYGIGFFGKRYYAIGWSVHLPSFHDNEFGRETLFNLIHLSHYKAAHKSLWFQRMFTKLENYKNDDGTYLFPRDSIREKKNSYFVGGNHLGVVENRRLRKRLRMESTYWFYVIKANMENAI
jgi:hypothetical protein